MAEHKAPTAVTIAPTREASFLQLWIARYWVHLLIICACVAGVILYFEYQKRAKLAVAKSTWGELASKITVDPMTRQLEGEPSVMTQVADAQRDNATGAWARLLQARGYLDQGQYDRALQALQQLQSEHPTHPLVARTFPTGEGGGPASIVTDMERAVQAQKAWVAGQPGLFSNPPPAADAPKVRLNTSRGSITLQLYPDKAPKHVANFIQLARDGTLNGTKFHRTVPGFMIQGGDPNSKLDDVTQWGQGGPGYTIPAEPSELYHFAGALSMAKKPAEFESSGSQFFITTNPAHHLDGVHTIFGVVIEGLDVAQQIGSSEIAPGSGDRPAQPVVIESAEVIEG